MVSDSETQEEEHQQEKSETKLDEAINENSVPSMARAKSRPRRRKRAVRRPRRSRSRYRSRSRHHRTSVASVCSTCSSGSQPGNPSAKKSASVYRRLKTGLRRSNPAAIVLWAFHKLPSEQGLTSRRVIKFLKNRYRVKDNPIKVGKCIGAMLRCAVEFGLLEKRGNRYFLKQKGSG